LTTPAELVFALSSSLVTLSSPLFAQITMESEVLVDPAVMMIDL